MSKITIRESELFTNYEAFIKKLNEQAQRCVYEIQENIPEMFFRICEELEIPAELLDRENLVESLSNVLMYIVRLSDELRLGYQESPDNFGSLHHYKRIVDTFCKLQFDKVFFRSAEELQLFFNRMDEKLQESRKDALAEHKISFDGLCHGWLFPAPPPVSGCPATHDFRNYAEISLMCQRIV
jgi:hypothetical protein